MEIPVATAMMPAPYPYTEALSVEAKILYVLHLFDGANTQELVWEIMELDGIASEEAVARLHQEVEGELTKLEEAGVINRLNVHGKRFALAKK